MISSHLVPLFEALSRLDEAWADAENGSELSRAQLLAAHRAIGVVQRRLDGLHAEVAAGIARESRPELGSEGLAKQQCFRSPATMIAATTGGSTGDASRLVKLGEATAPRANLRGEALPPRYPVVQAALAVGEVSAAGAAAIVAMLDRARLKADAARIGEAERVLVERAAGLALDEVRTLVARAEAWVDPSATGPCT